MIECEKCENWFHGSCVGITKKEEKTIQHYFCKECLNLQQENSKETKKELEVEEQETEEEEEVFKKPKEKKIVQKHAEEVREVMTVEEESKLMIECLKCHKEFEDENVENFFCQDCYRKLNVSF